MRPLLLLMLLAAPAAAQTPDSTVTRRPTSALVLGGAIAGGAAVLAANLALYAIGRPDESGWTYVFYPVGVAVGVHGVARERGLAGAFRAGATRAVLGAAVGYAVSRGFGAGAGSPSRSGSASAVLAAGAVFALLPPVAAAGAYRVPDVAPVVLRGPRGERAPGLALRVAL